ncbi:MAG TPA: phosphatidate cytidylyltransferase [Gammaproteobacteria bacterium]|jgi:phosphatidate cytidylyltransferase|nr:phosphatidate cytidylyltransferase [Gammaproteobacteria bacterium]
MLKKRILTAIVLIPLFLLILFYLPPLSFCLFTALLTMLAGWEWSGLMGLGGRYRFLYLCCLLLALVAVFFLHPFFLLWATLVWWLFAAFLVISYPAGVFLWRARVCQGVMGVFVLAPCWAVINQIRIGSDGLLALLILFALIWGADSVAYFVGRKWGVHKLAPRVSPGKSIEGLIGALVFSVLLAGVVSYCLQASLKEWCAVMLLFVVTTLFSVLGDLFESMIKRHSQVKDASQLLPGHGGFLDRIDSLTAAAPIFALGAWLLSGY